MRMELFVETKNGGSHASVPLSRDFRPIHECEHLFVGNHLGASHVQKDGASGEEYPQCLWDRDETKAISLRKPEEALAPNLKGAKRPSAVHALVPLALIGALAPLMSLMPDSIDFRGYCFICISMLVIAVGIGYAINAMGGRPPIWEPGRTAE